MSYRRKNKDEHRDLEFQVELLTVQMEHLNKRMDLLEKSMGYMEKSLRSEFTINKSKKEEIHESLSEEETSEMDNSSSTISEKDKKDKIRLIRRIN